jgi:hypothetical protein
MMLEQLSNIASADSEITLELPGLGQLPGSAGLQPALPSIQASWIPGFVIPSSFDIPASSFYRHAENLRLSANLFC